MKKICSFVNEYRKKHRIIFVNETFKKHIVHCFY